ncbi:MAG: pyruvate dehydrogenase (acetyl-transferring) E1 component subunit alpha [Alphaproteobacteria bacterium]|jgi:pyruvate dehydrogenase E1 component alpha subunit|nr:pyruvate dehydrogenase (acetyl-transferring) E1 component subunit alpha [Alphaproteobacteria bacterium]
MAGGIKLTIEDAKKIYKDMVLVRKFEEKCASLYSQGHILGFLHLYIGQEAVATGFNFLKNPQDTHITAYRCHAHALLQGEIEPKIAMAELLGKGTGSSKGKGGSMHIFSKEKGFFGGHGIVGAQIPIGTGLALTHKRKADGGINVAYMGDGAFPQGQVYEAFNLASLYNLPILFVLENNQYSMGTPLDRTYANKKLYDNLPSRSIPFGVQSATVDGMDVIKVMEGAAEAMKYVRDGKGPFMLEVKTYRYRGHSMSDPQKYRSKEEVDHFRNEDDPILNFEKYATDKKLLTAEDFKAIQAEVKKIVAECEEFAINSPEPAESELYTDILA